jgi:proteasome lid subunit RPN8/RPN11
MTVKVGLAAWRAIVDHGRRDYPLEACGLLAGSVEGDGRTVVERAFPLPNKAKSRVRFDIDPRDQLKAVLEARSLGLAPLGNYHSHPETPARPSGEDLKLFVDPRAAYLILSLAGRLPVLKGFQASGDGAGFRELELELPAQGRAPGQGAPDGGT